METIIGNAFKKHGSSLGIAIYKPYFFLDTEIVTDVQDYVRLNKFGGIRHCILTKYGYFDYIKKAYFDTLDTWATDCGSSVEHVCFGENRRYQVNGKVQMIPLIELLVILKPKKKTVEEILSAKKLTINDLWVMLNNTLVKFSCMSV